MSSSSVNRLRGLACLLLLLGASMAHAQDRPSNDGGVTFGAIDRATVRVFAVSDVTQETVRGRYRSRVLGIPEAGHGTGVVVDPRGVIVTAKHVIEGARHLAVRLPDGGGVLPTRVVYSDPELDFAILLVISPTPLTAIPLPEQPASLQVRQTVDAIGYPFDADRRQPQSARGIISGVLDDGHLQLDMALNPGNSGGPLLDQSENLVGIVVARADPSQGAQGIGIAVPIGPIRAAYDQTRTGGALSRAYRELQADAESAKRSAEAVDAIVRLGGSRVLQEAADFVDNPEASERIDSLRAMAERTRNADLLALLAAYFWDASQVMIERAGGVATPAQMPPGPAKQLADDLWRRAIATATRAKEADPSVLQRSPFVGYLAGAEAPTPAWHSSDANHQPPPSEGGRGWSPNVGRSEAPSTSRWRPWLLAGFNLFRSSRTSRFGFGARLGALVPVGPEVPEEGVAVRFLVGIGADVGLMWEGITYFVGTDIGLGIRGGSKALGWASFLLWSQGVQRGANRCDYYGCEFDESYTPLGFHLGGSLRIKSIHLGASFRLLAASALVGSYGVTWSFSAPQVSWTF